MTQLGKIGNELYLRISDLEKTLTGLDDEKVSNWEGNQEIDPEKTEMQERISQLEEEQGKILAKYEHMRQTISTVSEQVLRLKKKLRSYRTDYLLVEARVEQINVSFIPNDPEQLKELIISLRSENKELQHRIGKKEEDKPQGDAKKVEKAKLPDEFTSGQNLVMKGNFIVAGTKPQLLGCLLSPLNPDSSFANDFLSVYTCFLPSSALLQNIIARYEAPATPDDQRTKIFNLMKVWIHVMPYEFRDDPNLLLAAMEFIPRMAEMDDSATSQLLSVYEKKARLFESEPKIFVIPQAKSWSVLDMESVKFAKQLALHDIKLYKLIDPRLALTSPEDLHITKRIKAMDAWVDRELKKTEEKTAVIKKFIEIMEHCRRLRNFFGVFTILDAVRATSDENRKLMNKGVKRIEELGQIVSSSDNFANYRQYMEDKKLPSIPNFKFALQNFLECVNQPLFLGEADQQLVSFSRFRKAARSLHEIQFFQKSPYEKMIQIDPVVMGYVQALP